VALKYQFNKTALQQLTKDLKIRVKALPTLKAKETALRVEVKKARDALKAAKAQYETHKKSMAEFDILWGEFPDDLLLVDDVQLKFRKIAGVKIPLLEDIKFAFSTDSLFGLPAWVAKGVELLKESSRLEIEITIAQQTLAVIEYARKKTTQKVNLYEKVQIPEYNEALRKIKRFLEDQVNLEKASQKILKNKLAAEEAAA
jgi:V/A-type H+-transporting ATPase subunit D